MNKYLKKAVAESIGTFVLVFFACGTAIATLGNVVAVALSFGLVIVVMSYTIGNISGCHINPAVSLAFLIKKKINLKEFYAYIIAQFTGALIAAFVLYGLLKLANFNITIWATNGAINSNAGGFIASLGFEIILTFVFVYVILCVVDKEIDTAKTGLLIGATLTFVHLIGICFTGTSVNPARSFGPALISPIFGNNLDGLKEIWIFLIGPLVGGFLAAITHDYLSKKI